MDKDILYNNMNFPVRAAARAVCLGSHAARGDYGGCDSARAARLGSHAAHGGRGGHGSASTMRMVAMARLARCAPSAVGALRPRNRLYISAAPQMLFILMAATKFAAEAKK